MTKQADNTVELAAERYLADLRTKQISSAEADLKRTTDRLAAAQSAEQTATARWSKDEASTSQRDRVVEARADVEALRSLLDHHERALTAAKARHTPEQRTLAIELVTAQRAAAGFKDKLDPLLEKIEHVTATLIPLLREVSTLAGNQHHVRFELQTAAEQLGVTLPHGAAHVPDPRRLTSAAILKACLADDYSPYDWADYARPDSVMGGIQGAIPGARAIVLDAEAEHADHLRRSEAWQQRLHDEAERNSAPFVPPALPVQAAPAPAAGGLYDDRASLAR